MKHTKSNKTKYLKVGLGAVTTTALVLVPSLNQENKVDSEEINYSSLYTPGLSTLPGVHKDYSDEEKDYLDKLSKYGNRDGLYSKTVISGNSVKAICPDGQGGFFVGGAGGKLDHIDANGDLVERWTTKTLLGGIVILNIVPDGQGGFFIAGSQGKLDHIDSTGELVADWTTKTLLGGGDIISIVPDGQGGFFLGGESGKLDHIDATGELVVGWTAKTLINGHWIHSIISDNQGGFFVAGESGGLDHIDANGEFVPGWTTKNLLAGNTIYTMISDGQGGFFVGAGAGKLEHIDANGELVPGWTTKILINQRAILSITHDDQGGFFVVGIDGKIDHIDATGELVPGWTTKTLLGGQWINTIVPDGQGGFFIGGVGELEHLDKNGDLFGFNSWVKGQYNFDHDYNIYKDLLSNDWTTKTLLDNNPIFSMVPDGQGGSFVGGSVGKLDHIDATGELVIGWTTKTLLGGGIIFSMVPDGQEGFFVAGEGGKLERIDATGEPVTGWTTKTFFGGSAIYSMKPDGQGGFFIGGNGGKLDHIDSNGELVADWTTKTLLDGSNILSISPDGKGGFFVGGGDGKLDHIDSNGDLITGWTTKTFINSGDIKRIISDGKGSFFLGGEHGKLDHIDSNGELIIGWVTKTLLGGGDIASIVPDGQGGFFVGGHDGKLDHIDESGDLVPGWTTKIIIGAQAINSIVPDDQGGFFLGGFGGKLDHIDSNGELSQAETEEETKARWKNFYPQITVTTLPILSGTNPTTVSVSNGSISVNDFDNSQAKLQYRKGDSGTWIDVVPGVDITNLGVGTYIFQWVVPQWFSTPFTPQAITLVVPVTYSFSDLVISVEDTTNGGTALNKINPLPTGVSSIALDKTKVEPGETETVIATITYASGYTGSTTVSKDVAGALINISPNFGQVITSTFDDTTGATTLTQANPLPTGISSISIDNTSVASGVTETVVATITYSTGYIGPATVSQDIVGGLFNITPTFEELVTSTEDTTNGETTLEQNATLPTGISSVALNKTKVDHGKTETITATITYASGYAGPATVSQDIIGADKNISPTFNDLVTLNNDTTNGGTTLNKINPLPTGISSIALDKTKVDAGETETVIATITYASGYVGPVTVTQEVLGSVVTSSSSKTLIIALAVALPITILPLLGFAGYKLFKWRKNK